MLNPTNRNHFIYPSSCICLWSVMKKRPLFTYKNAHNSSGEGSGQTVEENWVTAVASLQYTDLIASGEAKQEKSYILCGCLFYLIWDLVNSFLFSKGLWVFSSPVTFCWIWDYSTFLLYIRYLLNMWMVEKDCVSVWKWSFCMIILSHVFLSAGSKDGNIRLWKCSADFRSLTPLFSIPLVSL